jgi:hypothetical protein
MATLRIIGKKGSRACKAIRIGASIYGYTGKTKIRPDALINYGLPSQGLDIFFKRYPSARSLGIVNRHVGFSKYHVCKKASDDGVKVPESKLSLDKDDDPKEWINKLTNSIGGKGIEIAENKHVVSGAYYQKFINNRLYELRVHAFSWIPKEEWCIQKRVGDEKVIAWNYKNGGHFITVNEPRSYDIFKRAADVSEKILGLLGMSFGAVDFLVTKKFTLYFIEINSAPGFSNLSGPIYINAFNRLKAMSKTEVNKYTT